MKTKALKRFRSKLLPLPKPPEDTSPDRNEVITCLGEGETVELDTGVAMEALVGGFNTARDLTTGIVTMQPEALLPYHTHPCGESITVLEGEAEISVEGRNYRLGSLSLPASCANENHSIA
jgi:quercetin dioxygenase-like cupin family protein